MARVDLSQFTMAMNAFEDLITGIKMEVEGLTSASTLLASAMTGNDAQLLLSRCKTLTEKLFEQERSIRQVITKVQTENAYYVKNLGVLE